MKITNDLNDHYNIQFFNNKYYQFDKSITTKDILINICKAVSKLHKENIIIKNLTPTVIYVRENDGDIIINVDGVRNILTLGYSDPEVLSKRAEPTKYSDLFSLASVLFNILVDHNPFLLGKATNTINHEELVAYYKNKPVFVFDPTDDSNCLDERLNKECIDKWNKLPTKIREAFIKTFSKDAIYNDYTKRISSDEWIKILT